MKLRDAVIEYEGKQYPCKICYKRMKSLTFRYREEDSSLRVSCPLSTSDEYLFKKINEFFPRLLKRAERPSPYDGDSLYLFGEKTSIEGFSQMEEKKKESYLKKELLGYLLERVEEKKKEMGIDHQYKVRVRSMKTRYGVNSKKSDSLTFTTTLVHYPKEVIDSVIVHELAHYYYFDHGDKFYEIVYRYCPDYKKEHAKLRKRIYGKDNEQKQ